MEYEVLHGEVLSVVDDSRFWIKSQDKEILVSTPHGGQGFPAMRNGQQATIAGEATKDGFNGLLIKNHSTKSTWSYYQKEKLSFSTAMFAVLAARFVEVLFMFVPLLNWFLGLNMLNKYFDIAKELEIGIGDTFKDLLSLFFKIVVVVFLVVFVGQIIGYVSTSPSEGMLATALIVSISISCSFGLGALYWIGLARLMQKATKQNCIKFDKLSILVK